MAFVQPTTKADICEISQGFASTSIFSGPEDRQDRKMSDSPRGKSNGVQRVVFRGRRRLDSNGQRLALPSTANNGMNNGMNNGNNNNNSRFAPRAEPTLQERLSRKRKFDVMQTGSDELADTLSHARTIRIPNLTFCYARKISFPFGVYPDTTGSNTTSNNSGNNSNNSQNAFARSSSANSVSTATPLDDQKTPQDAFAVMMRASKQAAPRQWMSDQTNVNTGQNGGNSSARSGDSIGSKSGSNGITSCRTECKESEDICMDADSGNNGLKGFPGFKIINTGNGGNAGKAEKARKTTQMSRFGAPVREADLDGTQEEWVTVFASYDEACNESNWKIHNKCGKIEEYQIKSHDQVFVLDLDSIAHAVDVQTDIKQIENFAVSHGMAGYLYQKRYVLHNPCKYWKLVDDNKTKRVSQCLISDMFRMNALHEEINGQSNTSFGQSNFGGFGGFGGNGANSGNGVSFECFKFGSGNFSFGKSKNEGN